MHGLNFEFCHTNANFSITALDLLLECLEHSA
jgi:hypothetical protein